MPDQEIVYYVLDQETKARIGKELGAQLTELDRRLRELEGK